MPNLTSIIRNFSIIAHIDHGKSTLADRLIELCGALDAREMSAQLLDDMDIERERGITIKARSVTLNYTAEDKQTYQLNLIDTPGHVDFAYEVSRSLAACEGALLLVDAAQGVEAQTVANCYNAIEQGLMVMPVLNKMDLPQANPDDVCVQIEDVIGLDATDAYRVSAKTGDGVRALLEAIVKHIPAPSGKSDETLQALIIDSWFDTYLGVVSLICIKQGQLSTKDKVIIMSTGEIYQIEQIGKFTPKRVPVDKVVAGEVCYITTGVKQVDAVPVGDTITSVRNPIDKALPGFKKVKPLVYAGVYPVDSNAYHSFRDALSKLRLNDAALSYEPESSSALGLGFRCGFLGMLHMEIVQERLEREYDLDLITTAPTVIYQVETRSGETVIVDSPSKLPEIQKISVIREPIAEAHILVPQEFIGTVVQLCLDRRGVQKKMLYSGMQVSLTFDLPMSEIVLDFYDRLKSSSRGYASLDYAFSHYQESDLVKVDILINREQVEPLAIIAHRSKAHHHGKKIADALKELIPRQMYDVAVQAALGNQIIARTTIKALRKNVTAKCYGGDISRKRKLLEKQKKGKKRMKQIGQVQIPQQAFLAVLKIHSE